MSTPTLMNAERTPGSRSLWHRGGACSALGVGLAAAPPRARTDPRHRRRDDRAPRRHVLRRANSPRTSQRTSSPRPGWPSPPSPRLPVRPFPCAPRSRRISDLVVELGRAPEPGRLRDALARAFHDPTLELGYWLPESGESPMSTDDRVDVTPARHGPSRRSNAVAARSPRSYTMRRSARTPRCWTRSRAPRGSRSRTSAAHRAARATRRDQRLAEPGSSRPASRNVGDSTRPSRRRGQRLVTLSLNLRMAQECLSAIPAAEEMLDEVGEDLKLALEELRDLARGLHPASSPIGAWSRPCSRSRIAPRFRSRSPASRPAGSRASKRRSISSWRRASPTRPSTLGHPARTSS